MIRISEFQSKWEFLQEKKLFLACSGGVDSMVLLRLLNTLPNKLTVLHINYQLRGKDSDEDEKLVTETCKSLGIECLTKRIDTKKALEKGGNLQDLARKYRYQWFQEILNQDEKNLIVLGHQSDDQLETFFQHIARKSGITGMAGMLESHAGIVRPLLHFTKAEIYAFANENNIAWREDLSNEGNAYTRNKLRNLILPEVEKQIPGLRESVLILVKAFQETHQLLTESVRSQVERLAETGNWSLTDYDQSNDEQKAEILRNLGIRQTFIPEIEKLRNSQKGKKLFTDGFEITRESAFIHFAKPAKENKYELKIEKVVSIPETFDKNTVYLDAHKITGNLHLRPWQNGDRMKPIGMKGSKAISDILKDAKIESHKKNGIHVVTDDEKILWCVGIKISAAGIAGSTSIDILKVSVIPNN